MQSDADKIPPYDAFVALIDDPYPARWGVARIAGTSGGAIKGIAIQAIGKAIKRDPRVYDELRRRRMLVA